MNTRQNGSGASPKTVGVLSPQQLYRLIDLHSAWLAAKPGGQRLDLSLRRLEGADLSGEIGRAHV